MLTHAGVGAFAVDDGLEIGRGPDLGDDADRFLVAHLTGGNFLLSETDPNLVFTPEDLSSEQRMMAQTAEKFIEKEVGVEGAGAKEKVDRQS